MAIQVFALLRQAIQAIAESGSDSPRLDAELLFMHLTHYSKVQLFTHDQDEVSAELEQQFQELVKKRVDGHPMAHILGQRDFWDLTLKVTADTLIPRPDTEVLVEKALELIDHHGFTTVLDLGTGTGAIILSLKHSRPSLKATAVDVSAQALAVAKENAKTYNLDVKFAQGSWFTPCAGETFDLIVSNPPYIEADDHHLKEGDVRFEPLSALVSGQDGLDDIRTIVSLAPQHIKKGGYLLIEHGYNQGEAVRSLFVSAGFTAVATLRDYGENERVTLGQL